MNAAPLPSIDTILGGRLGLVLREIDTVITTAILTVAVYLTLLLLGVKVSPLTAAQKASEFLGATGPVFLVAALFLAWVAGALAVEVLGLSTVPRHWAPLAAALFYVENAAPFVGLLECFISIVSALLAYSAAGAGPQAQSAMLANIAIALGASAAGCFIALCAHSLKALVVYRESRTR
jgi:hypothetical protein